MADTYFNERPYIRHLDEVSVSAKDKFKLAKTILFLSMLLYVAIALLYIFGEQFLISGPVKNVWIFSSQALFGIVNLIIGFYFGDKTIGQKSGK